MDISRSTLPSRGYKADLPEVLSMDMFGGASLNYLGKAMETNDMIHIIEALGNVAKFDVGQLSVPDAMFLAYLQRVALKEVSQLRVTARCRHPVFHQADGTTLYSLKKKTGPVVDSSPCNSIIYGDLDQKESLLITLPDDEAIAQYSGRTFSLPRAAHLIELGTASVSSIDWVALHLDMSAAEAKQMLAEQTDLRLWMELSNWAAFATHGLSTVVQAKCPVCGRVSDVTWRMVPQMFLL